MQKFLPAEADPKAESDKNLKWVASTNWMI